MPFLVVAAYTRKVYPSKAMSKEFFNFVKKIFLYFRKILQCPPGAAKPRRNSRLHAANKALGLLQLFIEARR
jgi:hypothetical protein